MKFVGYGSYGMPTGEFEFDSTEELINHPFTTQYYTAHPLSMTNPVYSGWKFHELFLREMHGIKYLMAQYINSEDDSWTLASVPLTLGTIEGGTPEGIKEKEWGNPPIHRLREAMERAAEDTFTNIWAHVIKGYEKK